MGGVGTLFCLRLLWQGYDAGGHSMGRSLRSSIVEKTRAWLERGNESSLDKAKIALSILVAMHYDYEYINRHNWFDFPLKGMWDIPLRDRILVTAAAIALGVDEIPSLDDWSNERIVAFLRGDEETIALLNEYKNG